MENSKKQKQANLLYEGNFVVSIHTNTPSEYTLKHFQEVLIEISQNLSGNEVK